MLTLLPGFSLVLIYAYKLNVLNNPAFLFNLVIAFLISLVSFTEGLLITPDFFYVRLDESWYYQESISTFDYLFSNHFRYLLYLIYSKISFLLGGEYIFKFHLIPFSLLTALVCFQITKLRSTLYLFPVVFAYVYFLATIHMRDMLIVFFSIFLLFKMSTSKRPFYVVIFASLIFLTLRAEFIIVFIITYFWMKSEILIKKGFFINYFIPGMAMILIISLPIFTDLIVFISDLFFPGRMEFYLALRSEEVSKLPFLSENASSIIRQLITPFPWSKLRSLFMEPMGTNLYVKEFLRIVLMSGYFIMFFWIIFNRRKFFIIMDQHSFLRMLFALSVQITILYAIFGDGGGATRNKLFPIIFVFLVFNYLINFNSIIRTSKAYEKSI